jgi:TolB protein
VPRGLLILGLATAALAAGAASARSEQLPGRIVFTSKRDGDHELYVMRADGKGLRRLTRNRVDDTCPAWSPDGRRIAFSRNRYSGGDLFVMRADGSGLRRVVRSPGWDSCPDWSPDGRSLVFKRLVMAVESKDRRDDLFTIRLNGRGLRRLTTDQSSARPSWSRLGLIAFHSRHFNLGFNDIWTMRPDGSDRRRLTMNENSDDPSWSPDGRTLVFVGPDNDWVHDRELFVIAADGTGLRQVTESRLWDLDPSWSPNGRWIAYAHAAVEGNVDLHVVRADGSGVRRLTTTPGEDRDPDWSP